MSTQLKTIKIKIDKPIVIITVDEYEGMKETIELLSCNPRLADELKKERKEMDRGKYITFKDIKKQYKIR